MNGSFLFGSPIAFVIDVAARHNNIKLTILNIRRLYFLPFLCESTKQIPLIPRILPLVPNLLTCILKSVIYSL